MVSEGHILPAEKESTLITLNALSGQEAFDFTEADGTVVKRTPLDNYKMTLEAKKGGVVAGNKFKEAGTPAEAAHSEISTKIAVIEKDEKVSFGEASKILQSREPGLFKEMTVSQEID